MKEIQELKLTIKKNCSSLTLWQHFNCLIKVLLGFFFPIRVLVCNGLGKNWSSATYNFKNTVVYMPGGQLNTSV